MSGGSDRATIVQLETRAKQIRRDILEMGLRAGGCHLAPALSSVELVTALYFRIMQLNPKDPQDDSRDRFIFGLENLLAIIDRNRLCADGATEEVLALEPLRERWASFGWAVREIDGQRKPSPPCCSSWWQRTRASMPSRRTWGAGSSPPSCRRVRTAT